jgi:sugar O-acyltransferase (sialic acid O-acetyltransferase NeuD family)
VKKRLLLLGGGGHCRSCIDTIEAQGVYEIAGIVQPTNDCLNKVSDYPVVGCDDDLPELLNETPTAIITVGQINTPDIRIRLFNLLKSYKAELPVVKSPFSYCSSRAVVGEGTILLHGSLVNSNAEIGANCIINSIALVEHDAQIASHCHIATGARVNGGVSIGQGSFLGSGCVIREGVQIGERTVIAAGEIVLQDIPAGSFVRSQT